MTTPAQSLPIDAPELAEVLASLVQRAQASGMRRVIVYKLEKARALAARAATNRACRHISPQRMLVLHTTKFIRCPDCGWQRPDPR